MSKWFVSRQSYWGIDPEDGQYTVEIASGGSDYANPDMLVPQFPGEGQEYNDPREAVRVAIDICKAWREEAPYLAEFIGVAHGYTGGNTIPFEQGEFAELVAWGEELYEELEKCDRCGDLIDDRNKVTLYDYEGSFCSEQCADLQVEFYELDNIICQVEDEAEEDDTVYVSDGGHIWVNPEEAEIERYNLRDPEIASELIWRLRNMWIYRSSIGE